MSVFDHSGEDDVRSPCINVCALDENDLCIGCRRSGQEIALWGAMPAEDKREVLRQVAVREKQDIIGG